MLSDRVGASSERTVHAENGDRIVSQGEGGREMFIVVEGRVRVSRTLADGSVMDLGHLGRGAFFGEMSLLESLPRDADVDADGPVQLLVLSPGALLARLRRDPTLFLELLSQLSGRLRDANARLRELGVEPT